MQACRGFCRGRSARNAKHKCVVAVAVAAAAVAVAAAAAAVAAAAAAVAAVVLLVFTCLCFCSLVWCCVVGISFFSYEIHWHY